MSSAGGTIRDVIDSVASLLGVPTNLAEAIAAQESGFNPTAQGDFVNGAPTSFGLYQLHKGGELGSLTPEQAYDPVTNADVALTQVAAVYKAHPNADPGWIAAAAQRPLDQAGYQRAIDALLAGHPTGFADVAAANAPVLPTAGSSTSTSTGSTSTSSSGGAGQTFLDSIAPKGGPLGLGTVAHSIVGGLIVVGFVALGAGLLFGGVWKSAGSPKPPIPPVIP